MRLALNLSFAVKRWMKPEALAAMVRDDFGIDEVQFCWDFIDPWWPEEYRTPIAKRFRAAFEEKGIRITSTFGGNAAYVFAHFLAPLKEQRQAALAYMKRAVDLTIELGSDVLGTPPGAFDYEDARDPEKWEELYQEMLISLRELAEYGKEKGLKEIHLEAVPVFAEVPNDPETSLRLMKDLEGSAIPYRLLIDWGHALYKPLLKEKADIKLWFRSLAPYIGSIHLQQTDGNWDRHWDFTADGIVTKELMKEATIENGLGDIPQYLEVVTIYEDDDDAVYKRMKETMEYLHEVFDTP